MAINAKLNIENIANTAINKNLSLSFLLLYILSLNEAQIIYLVNVNKYEGTLHKK